jgi:NACHT domain
MAADDEIDNQCLRDLRLTDPRHDKDRIEASKDHLLKDSCSWIFEDSAFHGWWTRHDSRFLWIHGDPGKGKTMMIMALISEVLRRLEAKPGSGTLVYFFCQSTSRDLNNTVSVLRGLIYFLVDQQRTLIRYLRRRHDSAGRQWFEGPNALYALRDVLSEILKDPSLGNVYLMIDALDECDPDIYQLLKWIVRNNSDLSHKIKWLATSRNEPAITEQLGRGRQLHTSLELNSLHVSRAVDEFIDCKVRELTDSKGYSSELRDFIRNYLLKNADGTFLWVALVCKALERVRAQKAKLLLQKFSAGLEPLYERMMEQVQHQADEEDANLCKRILRSVTLAFRPLQLQEIAIFANLSDDPQSLEDLVGLCGSFLTIRQKTAYFVHQSAKDYFNSGKGSAIFYSGQADEHRSIARLCLKLMSDALKRDICNLQKPGACTSEIQSSILELCLPIHIQYACQYWVDHLQQAGHGQQETIGLCDNGEVHTFLQHHFLHWVEALSLAGRLSEGVLAIMKLETLLEVNNFLPYTLI